MLTRAGVAAFGPTADAARIESSKSFCRAIAEAAGVPTAVGRSFPAGEATAAVAYARDLAASGGGVVVKADGLAAGKGVTVCASGDEAEAAIAASASSMLAQTVTPFPAARPSAFTTTSHPDAARSRA